MPTRDAAVSALEQETSASQADTEPLSFEDDDDDETRSAAAQTTLNTAMTDADAADADAPEQASPTEASMAEASTSNEAFRDAAQHDAEDFDDDLDAVGSDEEDIDGGDNSVTQAQAGGAAFSDDSDLTDESDVGNDEDAEGEDDDDEMGGDDTDEDDDEEDEDADAEGDEEEDEDGQGGDEDEALKGLAALTAATSGADTNGAADLAASGLDGLAVLAAAGADDAAEQMAGGDSDADSTTSSSRTASIKARRGRLMAKPRLGSRLNEVMVASEPASELEADGQEEEEDDEEDDDDDEDEDEGGASRTKATGRNMGSLGHLATAVRRTAGRTGASAGLLAGAPSLTIDEVASGAASLASSREASPKLEDEDEGRQGFGKGDFDDDENAAKDEDKELGTPLQELDEAVAEEDPSTVEAAVKRQEAMDTLTKIEIGFAVLRDKLYVERMEEISKEGEMILDGTHPDLIYLTNFIEARRERRLRLIEMWFEQQQKQYERVAHAEEAAAWNNWRNEVVQLRKRQLEDVSRKRRKLDREKRTLDGPRPARRHQIFETELVRNPDYDAAQAKHSSGSSSKGKRKGTPRQQEMEDLEEMGAYVAYPDLRSADDGEAWMDMDRMGIQPDVRIMPGMGYYVDGSNGGGDPYGMYMVEQGQSQRPPGGSDMMPPHGRGGAGGNGAHGRHGVVDDRGFEARGRPASGGGGGAVREVDGGFIVDDAGAPLPMGNYGGRGRPAGVGRELDDGYIVDEHPKAGPPMGGYGGGHPGGRMGHPHHPDDMYMDAIDPAGIPSHGIPPPQRNRQGSPPRGSRVPKQQGDDRMQGRKSEGQGYKRSHPRSPPPSTSSAPNRKRVPMHGSSGGPRPGPHHPMDGGPYAAYGNGPPPPPPHMVEDGYYDGGLPPPPPGYGAHRPPASGRPGGGPGYGAGPMMGPADSGPPPSYGAYPPPPPPGRRPAEAMYQR